MDSKLKCNRLKKCYWKAHRWAVRMLIFGHDIRTEAQRWQNILPWKSVRLSVRCGTPGGSNSRSPTGWGGIRARSAAS